jgi:hypothetical protein
MTGRGKYSFCLLFFVEEPKITDSNHDRQSIPFFRPIVNVSILWPGYYRKHAIMGAFLSSYPKDILIEFRHATNKSLTKFRMVFSFAQESKSGRESGAMFKGADNHSRPHFARPAARRGRFLYSTLMGSFDLQFWTRIGTMNQGGAARDRSPAAAARIGELARRFQESLRSTRCGRGRRFLRNSILTRKDDRSF